MKLELANCTEILLAEISNSDMKKRDIAQTYALALKSDTYTDWAKVNKAIIDRWSISALNDIKTWAWNGKCFRNKD